VTKAGGDAFRKEVEFTTKDDAEQRAVGIVMVPDKVDLQGDFAREETIRQFADQFENFVDAGEGDGGIMHAAWPSDWMSLERNEVLDEAEDINGTTAPAGAWVQEWQFNDADLWNLVDDGVLEGYSIGAVNVDWNGPYDLQEDDAVDNVDTPAQVPDDAMAWELIDGLIREVSAVDIPAVPDAEILDTKGLEKRLADHLGDKDGFVSEMMERGHSEEDAERAWDVLNRAIEVDGAGDPGKQSFLERVGKAAVSVLKGDGGSTDSEPTREKGGRTLSKQNRESAMAAVDANLDMLEDSGMDHGMTRFTDRGDIDFDLSEHDAREWGDESSEDGQGGDGEDPDEDDEDDKHAAGGDTPGDNTKMSDNDDGGDADKSLAEQNAEQISELTDAVKGLTETIETDDDPDADKTAEVELPDGSVAEVSKAEVDSWFEDDDGANKNADTEQVTKADIEALHRRLDAITREGGTQQLDSGSGNGDDTDRLDDVGKALS